MMTLSEAKRIAWSLGYRLEPKNDAGEYRVTPSQYKKSSDMAELLAYYTDSIEDALSTITLMKEGR